MNTNNSWGWEDFKLELIKFISNQEKRYQKILLFLKECDEIVVKIINRPLSFVGARPQDFVVASLVTRSFRLSLVALFAGLAGYEDAVPVLLRPLYEIGLRLLQIERDPIPASLGYLLGGVREEIRIAESWLQHLRSTNQPIGNLEDNIRNLKGYIQNLEQELKTHGLSPELVEKDYGKLNIKRVAKDFGINEHFYNTGFGFMSGYVHERGFAMDDYCLEIPDCRLFALGPFAKNPGTIIDVFLDLLRNLRTATRIVGEADLETRAIEVYNKINKAFPTG